MKNFAATFAFLCIWLTSSLLAQAQAPTNKPEQEVLANADIVKMVKSGLAENTILLVLQQSRTNFDVSSQAIISLKNQGVSQKILDAMLVPHSANVSATTKEVGTTNEVVPDLPKKSSFYYRTIGGWLELQTASVDTKGKSGGFSFKLKAAEIYQGAQSSLIIKEARPTFHIRCNDTGTPGLVQKRQELGLPDTIVIYRGQNLDTRYIYLLKLDTKKTQREILVLITPQGMGYPLNRTVEVTVKRLSDTVLAVEPKSDLEPGEYLLSGGYGSEIRYDFSIAPDK